MKVENNMDIVTEEDPVGIKTDELYIQSTFSVVKAEPEVSLFFGSWYVCMCVCFIYISCIA
jgi:hypothetical protein